MKPKRIHAKWRHDGNGGFYAWVTDPFGRVWESKRHASLEAAQHDLAAQVAEVIRTVTIQWHEVKL